MLVAPGGLSNEMGSSWLLHGVLKQFEAPFVLQVAAGVTIAPNCLSRMLHYMTVNPDAGIVYGVASPR